MTGHRCTALLVALIVLGTAPAYAASDDATSHKSFADVQQWVSVFDDPARDGRPRGRGGLAEARDAGRAGAGAPPRARAGRRGDARGGIRAGRGARRPSVSILSGLPATLTHLRRRMRL